MSSESVRPGPYAPITLLIDDDEMTIDVLRQHMLDIGASQVHCASTGYIALQTLKSMPRHPDLILCDVFMPDMDGIEFLECLVQQEYKGGVIVISGGDYEMLSISELIGQTHGLNLLASMRKPVTLAQLKQVLKLPQDIK